MPVMPGLARSPAAKPGSSDQASTPMTWKRGSSVSRSMRTRSMAPGAARWPPEIWAPSKAGPVGLEAASSRLLVAEHDLGVGADVDDERHLARPGAAPRRGSRRPCRRRHGRRCRAGRRRGAGVRRAGRAPRAVVLTARSVASANGAPPSGGRVDAEQEVVHDRVADDRAARGSRSRLMPARIGEPDAISPSSASRTAVVISPAPSGCIIAYETRLIRSSPKRICGFITPLRGEDRAVGQVGEVAGDRRRADVDGDAVGRLVEARPDADDLARRRGPRR